MGPLGMIVTQIHKDSICSSMLSLPSLEEVGWGESI